MGKKLKIYGGCLDIDIRGIVCASTKKRALELLSEFRVTPSYFNGHWCETSNPIELSVAIEEGVWSVDAYISCKTKDDYKRKI